MRWSTCSRLSERHLRLAESGVRHVVPIVTAIVGGGEDGEVVSLRLSFVEVRVKWIGASSEELLGKHSSLRIALRLVGRGATQAE